MQRVLLVTLAIVVVVGLIFAGCAKPAPVTPTPTPTPGPTPSPIPTPAPTPTPVPVADITLVFNTYEVPVDVTSTDLLQPYFAELEKRTGGRVKVEAHYSGELVNVRDSYDAILKGTVDMVHFLPGHVAGKFLSEQMFLLPTFDNIGWRYAQIAADLYEQFPEMAADWSRVKRLLTFGKVHATYIATTIKSNKPIRKLEDCEGLKMCGGTSWVLERQKNLGLVPVDIPPPAVAMALEKGTVDGNFTTFTYDVIAKHYGEYIMYYTLVPTNRGYNALAMSLDKWNSLPPDIQEIMDNMEGWLIDKADEAMVRAHNDALVQIPKVYPDIELIELSPEELARWIEYDRPVIERFIADLEAKGLPGRELYDVYQELERKYSAPEYEFK